MRQAAGPWLRWAFLAVGFVPATLLPGVFAQAGAGSTPNPKGPDSLRVVATTSIIADIARQVAGPHARVLGIIPAGSDPHIYEPVPTDAQQFATAHLVLRNGLHLEGWLDKLLAGSGSTATVRTVTDGIEVLFAPNHPEAEDPHAWAEPLNGISYARNIAAALQQLDPVHHADYAQRLEAYVLRLQRVHRQMTDLFEAIPEAKRVLITNHDAFQYLARRYGLRVAALMGTSTDADVQALDVRRIHRVIDSTGVPAVFVESTINPKLMRQLAQDGRVVVGGPLYTDALGLPGSGAETYERMLLYNARTIQAALLEAGKVDPLNTELLGVLGLSLLLFGGSLLAVALLVQRRRPDKALSLPPLLEIRDLSLTYDRKPVLVHVNLDWRGGRIIGLVGANGGGKSSLLKAVLGQVTRDAGTVRLNGEALDAYRSRIAYVPQHDEVDWRFPATVWDLVLTGRYAHRRVWQRMGRTDRAHTRQALEAMGIANLAHRHLGELSGGQRQRAFLARALAQEADLLLLDEPFVGVDAATEARIMDLLRQQANQGKLVVVVHHDLSKVRAYFHEVVLINRGIVAAGPTAEVFTAENLQLTYGGWAQSPAQIALMTQN